MTNNRTSVEWVAAYPRSTRPTGEDIAAYLAPGARRRFRSLMDRLADLGLRYVVPKFTKADGWRLAVGKSGLIMIDGVRFGGSRFTVEGAAIADDAALGRVLTDIEARYHSTFTARFEAFAAERGLRQKQRTARRQAREKAALDALMSSVSPEQLNVFNWSPRVSRRALRRLYDSDAQGLGDTEQVEEIGGAFYARCVQARDERALMDSRRLKCHGCRRVLEPGPDPMRCPCGRAYQFRQYMRSFRTAQMPRGAAAAVFDGFIDAWPKATSYAAKMRLVDNLIHACHVSLTSGVRGRPVAINLIQGTVAQIREFIQDLAGSA